MKRLLTGLSFLLLIVGCSKKAPEQRPPTIVKATMVSKMNVPIFRDYVGNADSGWSVDIKSRISGTIVSQLFNGGDRVKAGDILFTIDSRQYEAELQKAESSLEQNLASLSIAKEKAESYTQLIKDDIVSQLDYDQSLTDVLNLEAKINQDKADINLAQINVNFCTIRSPIDGIAGLAGPGVGDYVSVGSPVLVTILDLYPMLVNFYVPEAHLYEIRQLKNDQALRVQAISTDASPHIHEGTLTRIDNTVDIETGTILMKASFPNKSGKMWPGEYYKTRLYFTTIEGALVVPDEAILTTQSGHQIYIVKEDASVELRPVTLGEHYNNMVIVEKGVKEGEVVVVQGQLNITTGAKVMVKEEKLTSVEKKESACPEMEQL